MGRELGIHRIDFLKDGTAVVRHSDYNLCGRTDFTGQITDMFYNFDKEICYLLLETKDDDVNPVKYIDTYKVHVKVEDDYWSEKEFDMDYSYARRSRVREICNECMAEDDKELAREQAMLEDARIARQHTTTLKDFTDFSELIDSLQEHYNDYRKEAYDYAQEILRVERMINQEAWPKPAPEDVEHSYVLLTYSE